MTNSDLLQLELLEAILNKLLMVPGVATYDEDVALLAEASAAIDQACTENCIDTPTYAGLVTFPILKAKLTELVDTKGVEAAKKVLSIFHTSKLVYLDEKHYAHAYTAAATALEK